MHEEQLERLVDRLTRDFDVSAAVSRPWVDVRRQFEDRPEGPVMMDVVPWVRVTVRTPAFYEERIIEALPSGEAPVVRHALESEVLLSGRFPLSDVFGLRQGIQLLTDGAASVVVTSDGYAPALGRDDDDDEGVGVRRRPSG